MKLALGIGFLFLFVSSSWGQGSRPLFGSCSAGRASTELNIGNVRARIVNDGGLFWNGSPSIYEVPIGSGINAIFADELNIVGYVDGDLRVAASIWGGHAEFWPGPILNPLIPPVDCSEYDKIWSITRDLDLRTDFADSPSQVIIDWPTNLGAPYVDVNADFSYDPNEGDYPQMLGDQMHWWIMNDVGNEHRYAKTLPLGIEVIVSAFAFNQYSEFNNVTFFRYQIRNRQPSRIENVYVGKFLDADVGFAEDDFVGTDSSLSMVYTYNDSNVDSEYGEAPPAIGLVILEASHSGGGLPTNLSLGNGSFLTHSASALGFDPGSARDPIISVAHRNLMMGRVSSTGEIMTEGGPLGSGLGAPTPFYFPGDPVTGAFWSERNLGDGQNSYPWDRKMIGSFGPFSLEPNESATFTFAYLWARGVDYLDSITALQVLATQLHEEVDDILSPQMPIPTKLEGLASDKGFNIDTVYPNPANESAHIQFSVPISGSVEFQVFDLLSRKVATKYIGFRPTGSHGVEIDTRALQAGLYQVVLLHPSGKTSRSLVVTK